MKPKPEKAWAAFCTFGTPGPFIYANTVHDRQGPVRDHIAKEWAHPGETLQQGWRRAYRAGWRVIRVEVTAV